jgi:hypothetical protein
MPIEPLDRKFLMHVPSSMIQRLQRVAEDETERRNIKVSVAHLIREIVARELDRYDNFGELTAEQNRATKSTRSRR